MQSTLKEYCHRDRGLKQTRTHFFQSWQILPHWKITDSCQAFDFCDSFLSEPLLVTTDPQGQRHILSNVCTHRGHLLYTPSTDKKLKTCTQNLTCPYHGRRFDQSGRCTLIPHAPFQGPINSRNDLPSYPHFPWHHWTFHSFTPKWSLSDELKTWDQYLSLVQFDQLPPDPTHIQRYSVKAHWTIYVENYLEGLHIPYIHPELARTIKFDQYKSQLGQFSNIQLAWSGAEQFDLPSNFPLSKGLSAIYLWIFPNLMFNFYPWGLSLNIVRPVSEEKTEVDFLTFPYRDLASEKRQREVELLDLVERQDEMAIESVARGLQSFAYRGGDLVTGWEETIHHFENLLSSSFVKN